MKIKKKHIFRFFGPFFSSFIIFGWDFVENEKNHQKSTVILLHFWLSKQKNYFWSHAKLAKMSSFQCTVGRVHMHMHLGWEHHIKMGIGVPCDAPAVTFAPLTNISRCTATWENSGFYRPCALYLRSVAILLSPSILLEAHQRINHWP